MAPTAEELAQLERFDAMYDLSRSAVFQHVTDDVCGCGYIGSSWTTRAEADHVLERLGLGPRSVLLELGAGAGWPGLYLARKSKCEVTLVDMPETGIRLAMERARSDGIANRVNSQVADAADLPFQPGSFTAINHSDLLCCLIEKRRVLEECRRVLDPRGLMAFTVISLPPGLSEAQRALAIENGPPFVEAECGYAAMLHRSGWRIIEHNDITDGYEAACRRMLAADRRYGAELASLLGPDEARLRRKKWEDKLAAVERRLSLREFYLASPA